MIFWSGCDAPMSTARSWSGGTRWPRSSSRVGLPAPGSGAALEEPTGGRTLSAPNETRHDADCGDLHSTPARISFHSSSSIGHRSLIRCVSMRGERYRIQVDLPPKIPEGMISWLAGASCVGSDDDERVRVRFLTAAPMHECQTASFLIGRLRDDLGQLARVPPGAARGRARAAPTARHPLLLRIGGAHRRARRPIAFASSPARWPMRRARMSPFATSIAPSGRRRTG